MSVTASLDAASLGKLRETFRGQLILPGDRDYDASRIVWKANSALLLALPTPFRHDARS